VSDHCQRYEEKNIYTREGERSNLQENQKNTVLYIWFRLAVLRYEKNQYFFLELDSRTDGIYKHEEEQSCCSDEELIGGAHASIFAKNKQNYIMNEWILLQLFPNSFLWLLHKKVGEVDSHSSYYRGTGFGFFKRKILYEL